MTPTPQKPHWPTPITDRPPCADDADVSGQVQYVTNTYGYWAYAPWENVAEDRDPWLHTPQWEPRVTREEAEAALASLTEFLHMPPVVMDSRDEELDVIRTYITQTAP